MARTKSTYTFKDKSDKLRCVGCNHPSVWHRHGWIAGSLYIGECQYKRCRKMCLKFSLDNLEWLLYNRGKG